MQNLWCNDNFAFNEVTSFKSVVTQQNFIHREIWQKLQQNAKKKGNNFKKQH